MSWPASTANVPPAVSAMRDMIVASASFVAAGGAQAQVHYPAVQMLSSVTLPAVLITQEVDNRDSYAAGSGGCPTGTLRLEVYTAGRIVGAGESLAYNIAKDLAAATTGLAIRTARAGIASDPAPFEDASNADSASSQYVAAQITVDYGLTL